MKIMYDKAKEYALCGNNLLDLYCGTGTIGIYLKDNYLEIIKVYNNKGLKQEANKALKISDFSERAYRYLREDTDAKTYIKKLLPTQLSLMK